MQEGDLEDAAQQLEFLTVMQVLIDFKVNSESPTSISNFPPSWDIFFQDFGFDGQLSRFRSIRHMDRRCSVTCRTEYVSSTHTNSPISGNEPALRSTALFLQGFHRLFPGDLLSALSAQISPRPEVRATSGSTEIL